IYQWRQEPIPPRYEDEPLVYQGGSDVMLAGHEPIVAVDEAHGVDLEAEIAVVTTDVPMGASAQEALDCIALVVLLNDVSLRALAAGSIVGAGTISNADPARGNACITEARVRQMLDGVPEDDLRPYLKHGDRVRIEVKDPQGRSVFGAIDQEVRVRPRRHPRT